MANQKNPLTDRVKKMAVVIEAAKKAGEEVQAEKEAKGQAETGQPSQSPEQAQS